MPDQGPKPGSKHERERLRHELTRQGAPVSAIAAEMTRRWGFRPRQAWRHANGLTQDDVALRYNDLVKDRDARMVGKRISDFEAWPRGGQMPSAHVLLQLADVLGASVADLVDSEDMRALPAHVTTVLRLGTEQGRREEAAPPLDPVQEQVTPATFKQLITAAAEESRMHAERAEIRVTAPLTLEQLTDDVVRLSREHLYVNSTELFGETLRARNQAYRLLELDQYPREKEYLYYLAGILCCLLSDTALSVGFPRAATDLAQSAFAYGEIAGHDGLRLWSRTMTASVAFWNGRVRRANELNDSGDRFAGNAIRKVQIANGRALFQACTGRHDEARASLDQAREHREQVTGDDELIDRIGGMFAYPPSKQLQIASMTLVQLGDHRQAVAAAEESLRLYRAGPPESRAFGNEAAASIELARCQILAGELDAAEHSLRPVLALPPSRRQQWFLGRLQQLLDPLSTPTYAKSVPAAELADVIEQFCSVTARDEFPHSE